MITIPSFKDFVKDPVKAILFITIVATTYLYLDVKSALHDQITTQQAQINSLQNQVYLLQNKLLETITNHTKPNEIHFPINDSIPSNPMQ